MLECVCVCHDSAAVVLSDGRTETSCAWEGVAVCSVDWHGCGRYINQHHPNITHPPHAQLTSKQEYQVLGYYTWLYEGSQTMR